MILINSSNLEINKQEIIQMQNDIKEMNKSIIEIKQELAPTNKTESKWYQNRDLQDSLILIVFAFYAFFLSPKLHKSLRNESYYVQIVSANQIFTLIFLKSILTIVFNYLLNS